MLYHLCLAVTRHVYYYLCCSCLYSSIKFLLLCHLVTILDQFLLASLNLRALFPILQIHLAWTDNLVLQTIFCFLWQICGNRPAPHLSGAHPTTVTKTGKWNDLIPSTASLNQSALLPKEATEAWIDLFPWWCYLI